MRKKEINWFYEGGAAAIFPDGIPFCLFVCLLVNHLSMNVMQNKFSFRNLMRISSTLIYGSMKEIKVLAVSLHVRVKIIQSQIFDEKQCLYLQQLKDFYTMYI